METSNDEFDYQGFRKNWDDYLEQQKYKQAEAICHEALGSQPEDKSRGRLYNHLGYLYENFLEDKTFDDILEHYVLSLQVDESNANSHYNLSNFLLEQGMQHLLRALELNSEHKKARKRLLGLQPIRNGAVLELEGKKYRITDVSDHSIKGIKLGSKSNNEIDITINNNGNGTNMDDNTNNIGGTNKLSPLNIESSNNYNDNINSYYILNNFGCCTKFILSPILWTLIFSITIASIIIITLAYFKKEPFYNNNLNMCFYDDNSIFTENYNYLYSIFGLIPIVIFNIILVIVLLYINHGCCTKNKNQNQLHQSQQQSMRSM